MCVDLSLCSTTKKGKAPITQLSGSLLIKRIKLCKHLHELIWCTLSFQITKFIPLYAVNIWCVCMYVDLLLERLSSIWLLIFSFSDIFTRNIFVDFCFFSDFGSVCVHSFYCRFLYAFEINFSFARIIV